MSCLAVLPFTIYSHMNDAFGSSFIISKLCYVKSVHTYIDDGLLSLKHVALYYIINIQLCWWHFVWLLIYKH